ncbi:acetylase [Stutzerimonas chloritidismutans AW-1]|uniref:Acetylase n=2 Tax=Stutzerimonas chloritidismutans TaxID=203192 RepID=V4PUB5_STUCH|nr:acetylase [Stutzerimonas chloritidismutans AW-1]
MPPPGETGPNQSLSMIPTPAITPTRGQYFPYIDGLRAFAVLSVLIYHLNPAWLPGGFVGVDVFFVISGFVVSASIASFRGQGLGAFLAYFYARRIKRIFPALIVCLLITAYVSALFIPSSWLSAVNQQTGLFAFFGLSNFILARTGRDYFAPTTEFNPYTHTWSLAVEEQFYLIFPFLIIGWLVSRRGRWVSVGLFAIGLLASMAFAGWQSAASPTQAYFLSPSRFWELAAGVLLYQLITLFPAITARPAGRVRGWLGGASLGLLLLAFVVSTAERFPMPGALLAVLGTLGLIYSLHLRDDLKRLHGLLGSKPLVAVGKISYSLYLWHWPVFVLFRWTVGLETPLLRAIAVLLAFALAILSYRLVENPLRHAGLVRRAPQGVVIICGLLVIGGGWWLAARMADNLHELSLSTLSRNQDLWYPHGPATREGYPGCTAEPEYHDVEGGLLLIYKPRGCAEPRPLGEASIHVIGDSHALAYEGLFKQYAIARSVQINAYNNGGCPFISLQPWRDLDNADCRRYADAALRHLRERIKPGDILFLPSLRIPRFSDQWAYFGEADAQRQMFGAEARAGRARAEANAIEVLREFSERGVQIVFEAPKPLFKAPPFRCADWFNRANPICAQGLQIPRELIERFRGPVLASYDHIASAVPRVGVWDPLPVLCPEPVCEAVRGELPLYLDGDHLSGYGNLQLFRAFDAYMADRLNSAASKSDKR